MEVLILLVILPMVMLSVGVGIYVAFRVSTIVVTSVDQSSAAQVTAATFSSDAADAQLVTVASGAEQCGVGRQILGLAWGLDAQGSPLNVVSYVAETNGATTTLVRNFCASGFANTPTNSSILATDVEATSLTASLEPSTGNTGWVTAANSSTVVFGFSSPDGSWPVTVVGLAASAQSGAGS